MDLVSLLTSTTDKGGGVNPNAWDISKAYYDAGADAWDISKAFYSIRSFSVTSQETTPTGLFFKPDGTKMYVTGPVSDNVNEYTLSTPWLVSSASYVQNFSVAAQATSPRGLFFKPDGTKMYVIGEVSDAVHEYDLSSAWDISTASHLQSFSVATEDLTPQSAFFKPDGTKMYVLGQVGDDVNEYDLSSAWDISTASYVQNFSISTQEVTPSGLFFKPDGTKMYVSGTDGDDINEYSLSSAWDISSASYVQNFSVSAEDTSPRGLFFHPNGSGFYVVGATNDTVYQYTIGGFSVAAQETVPSALFFKPDGTKMYVVGADGDDVNEYDLSSAWNINTASYLQNFSVATEETSPAGLFFKPDGTKMYIVGTVGDDVNEYSLSSAWDISTASYVQNFSVASQDTSPTGVFFKPDGTKMYVVGTINDAVNEYSLSSAWDISTSSYVQNFSVSTQEPAPQDLFFKPDGTKMYVIGSSGDDVNEYSLSSAWDISTASYVQNFFVISQELASQGLFWKDDGSQFWIVGTNSDKVFSYLISPT
jgi:DNA-binding beta-propeller fold protein YncE